MSNDAQSQGAAPTDRQEAQRRLAERMAAIEHKIVVLSGKGGVGKSTVATNLAVTLSTQGFAVGLLDADFHGPSVPTILDLVGTPVHSDGQALQPVQTECGLRVMSMALLVRNRDDAVIWRGPLKMGALRQLLADTDWGELDFLVIDLPPGTGDEALSVCQLLPEATGGVVVTTPQELSVADVRKCIGFCRQLQLPVLGVLENMSGFVCPRCGERSDIFGAGGGREMCRRLRVPFLGEVPIDPRIVAACDAGRPFVSEYPDSPAAVAFREAMRPVLKLEKHGTGQVDTPHPPVSE